jgi:molecular chaperone DnaK (HSP70)
MPCAFGENDHLRSVYEQAFAKVVDSTNHNNCSFVPDPVAAVWGAQFQNVLPVDLPKDATVLVIDVGGWTTQVAVVRHSSVLGSCTLPWGGECVVETAVDLLTKATSEPLHDARSLALLQVQARHAVQELSRQPRVHVHVPYLFADPKQHHLDTELARVVLEQAVQEDAVQGHHHGGDCLSPHLPPPVDLASLWTSVVTQTLEQSAALPASVDHVLLVGGGSKVPLVQASVRAALQVLDADSKLRQPDPAVLSELTVLGAASLLPSFEYNAHEGLVRRSD